MDRDLKVDREICAHFNKLVKQGAYEMGSPATRESVREILKFALIANKGWPHAIERALKAEELAWELVEVLKKHEQWEADFILDDKAWATVNGLPQFTQELYDAWLEFQTVRNKALVKAKEALGDD